MSRAYAAGAVVRTAYGRGIGATGLGALAHPSYETTRRKVPALLAVGCWCERATVRVSPERIARGETETCGGPGCEPGCERVAPRRRGRPRKT